MSSILSPFIYLIEFTYTQLHKLTGNYGFSLILLSFVTSGLMFIVRNSLKRFPEREENIQRILQPQLDKIGNESNGIEKHNRIIKLYSRYNYNPILAFRSAIPIFIQLPFLFAAYYVLNNYEFFAGIEFGFVKDLSKPDLLLSRDGVVAFSISILPILMTAINMCSTFLMPKFNKKSRNQAILIALFLFVLLYKSSSALLFYWTTNNIIFALGALYQRLEYNKLNNFNFHEVFSIKNNYFRIIRFINERKLLDYIRIYLSLLILFVILFTITTGLPLLLLKGNSYIFLSITIAFYIISAIIKIRNRNNNKTIISFFYVLILLVTLIIGFYLQKRYYSCDVYRTYFYCLALFYSIIGFIPATNRLNNILNVISTKYAIFIISLFSLSPAIFLARANPDYLSGIYYLVYFAIFVTLALIVYFWIRFVANSQISNIRITVIASSFVFLVTLLPVIRAHNARSNVNFIDFILMFTMLFFLVSKIKSKKQFEVIKISGISLFSVLLFSFLFFPANKNGDLITESPDDTIEINFSDKPNIYLLVYDGSPNEINYDNSNLDKKHIKSIFVEAYGEIGRSTESDSTNGTFLLFPYTEDDEAKMNFLILCFLDCSKRLTVPLILTSV